MTRIRIEFSEFSMVAELMDSSTGQAVREKLPFSSRVNRWGEEIYFSIPVSVELEQDARDVLEKGEIGYWPPGKAMAIFFGPTPASVSNECRAASEVNIFARLKGDLGPLSSVSPGSKVLVCLEPEDA